jgi:hypothetical protein
LGWFGLFFKPGSQGLPADPKDAFDGSHTGAFVIGSQDLFFLCFGVAAAGMEDTAFATIFASELLTAAGVMAVLDDV